MTRGGGTTPRKRGRSAVSTKAQLTRLGASSAPRAGEGFVDGGPVDDIPPSFDVIRFDVVILQVVGVFPHIEGKERGGASAELEIVLLDLEDHEAVADAFVDEHGPAAAFDAGGGASEAGAEGLDGTGMGVAGVGKRADGFAAGIGGHDRPIAGVEQMSAEIEGQVFLQAA